LETFGFRFFVGEVVSGMDFRPFWLSLPGTEHQLLKGIL